MKLIIDTDQNVLTVATEFKSEVFDLYSDEAFEIISREWTRVGWNQKHQYTFSWLGRPIIQLPEDLVRVQEVIYSLQPDFIIETGVAHGGSLILYASLCHSIGKGHVIGVDVDIREHNRAEIEKHALSKYISLIQGDSTADSTIGAVGNSISKNDVVLVILDSNHSYDHVLRELELYSDFVSIGSFIIATDGIMKDLADTPRGSKDWARNNPSQAAIDFCANRDDFDLLMPEWTFNESTLTKGITHWPNAWLKKIA